MSSLTENHTCLNLHPHTLSQCLSGRHKALYEPMLIMGKAAESFNGLLYTFLKFSVYITIRKLVIVLFFSIIIGSSK